MVHAKTVASKSTITVYRDRDTLALRFSTKYNPIFEELDGKALSKPKCMGLGGLSANDPKNWNEAQRIALEIEADLQHKDWLKLFDPTFAKYGIGDTKYAKGLAEVLQLPTATPQWTVGKLWEDYLAWKEGQLEPHTFQIHFQRTYTNALKGLKWDRATRKYTDTGKGIWDLPLTADIGEKALAGVEVNGDSKKKLLLALNEAYNRALNLGHITNSKNPFFELHKKVGQSAKEKYESRQNENGEWLEWWEFEDEVDEDNEDRRAFTKEERDTIIKAFYESELEAKHQIAPLIEFLFLTGCRHGEAFALRWRDVNFERGYVRISKSYSSATGLTGGTKNSRKKGGREVRMFKLYPTLTALLQRTKPENAHPNDLVFKNTDGDTFNTSAIGHHWRGREYSQANAANEKVTYAYPGIVTQLADEGKIRHYLKPYATRHTFITLQAQAGTDLVLLAAICGNSVEMIYKHYLGVNEGAQVTDI